MLIEFHILLLFYAGTACAFALAFIICRIISTKPAADDYQRLAVVSACLTAIYCIILTTCGADPILDELTVLSWLIHEFILSPSFARLKFMLIGITLALTGVVYAIVITLIFPRFFQQIRLTVRRKVFHFLAAGVFYAGLQLDPLGLVFAAGMLQLGFIIIELCIAWQVEPIARIAVEFFARFLKSSELRRFGLSHTSLLIALGVPLWCEAVIHSNDFENRLPTYAGIVSVGVGDSIASFAGTWCAENLGRKFDILFEWRQWLKNFEFLVGKRTIIGSVAMLVSQLATWWAIVILFNGKKWILPSGNELLNSRILLHAVFWPSMAATLGELFGGDFDNLAAAGIGYLAFYV